MRIRVPTNEWISANDRMHWAAKASRTKRLRRRGYVEARRNGLLPTNLASCIASIQYATGGRADPANAYPTVKALIDGLIDFGVLPDDDAEHLLGPAFTRTPGTCERGWHIITLTLTSQEAVV